MATADDLLGTRRGVLHSVEPDSPVLDAIKRMAQHGVGALLVMRGTILVGIVSERDYARKIVLLGRSSNDTAVQEIMSSPVTSVAPTDSLDDCMRLMTNLRIRHLPVVDGGTVIGVLSIGDLVKSILDEQQRTIEQLQSYIHS